MNKQLYNTLIILLICFSATHAQLAGPKLPGLPTSPVAIAQLEQPQPESPIEIQLIPQFASVAPGQSFYIALQLELAPDWHIYANPNPGMGIPTEIMSIPDPCLTFGDPLYPLGRLEKYPDGTSDRLYETGDTIFIPVTVNPNLTADPPVSVTAKLNIEGQLCLTNGICKLWSDFLEITIPLTADQTTAAANQPEVFADLDRLIIEALSAQSQTPSDESAIDPADWLTPIALAILVGLVMNLMPCVLPIIPIVVMTLVNSCAPTGDHKPKRHKTILVGLAFAAGIMLVFAALAVLMSAFKLVWGQQFQSSAFKFILLMIVFILSLSMFGLFEIILPASLSNISIKRKGYLGAFGMGVLATVLATPCGAPLLTPVLVWSLAKPLAVTILVFLIIGLGMAIPYIILTASPSLINRIPKAGNWMITLKHAIGFAMIAFAAYLLLLFPPGWYAPLIYFCIVIAFAIWLAFKAVSHASSPARKTIARLIAIILVAVAAFSFFSKSSVPHIPTHDISQLDSLTSQGQTTIVKFTANWCKNCSVLDRTIYKTQTFYDALNEINGALIIVDLSNNDPQLTAYLNKLTGQALPFAAVFPPNDPDNPILLRDFYSMEDVLTALQAAHDRPALTP